jgi:hypothetical protein
MANKKTQNPLKPQSSQSPTLYSAPFAAGGALVLSFWLLGKMVNNQPPHALLFIHLFLG